VGAISSEPFRRDFAMDIEYFERDAPSGEVVAALCREGAAVVRDQGDPAVADTVLAELRPHFDKEGRPTACGTTRSQLRPTIFETNCCERWGWERFSTGPRLTERPARWVT
jgi:hypothetical protein